MFIAVFACSWLLVDFYCVECYFVMIVVVCLLLCLIAG